ncbi:MULTISPECIES: ribosome-associated translation inhibitor RaiA [unclassified Psychrobacter]|uniref:ribosome hibernation-promoting factor, HPF/YfiA family n=1 Tax=unclassified Psychrobacter TaxID=196806 RepID=UPI0009A89545|nr:MULTISPECIES: ribosome-associated translation inhibitor RaiA [unclassified Psychrobacter]OXL24641.1 ribosomal subunit interface protein [Psychrobacter sp. DAB_AL32B]SLJ83490.1 sigma 54 modulation protein/ribosomal protein S30EA [Psychrobacter sp. DAB_AL43B]
MNVSISGHHISVTDAMDTAVREKLEKVERHFDQIQSIQVILSLDNSGASDGGQKSHKAEAIMRVSGKEMFVQACEDDMYKAINEMADKLDRQVRKYKTKLESKKTQGAGRDGRYEDLTTAEAAPAV